MMLTVMSRHGPSESLSHLLSTLHLGLTSDVQRIAAADAVSLVVIDNTDGTSIVHVDDTVLPVPIARVLEGWIAEMIARNVESVETVEASCSSNESACNTSSVRSNRDRSHARDSRNASTSREQHTYTRHLLFFQELVMAVEMRVRDGWDKADRLHEAFAQSITQILTYRNFGNEQTVVSIPEHLHR